LNACPRIEIVRHDQAVVEAHDGEIWVMTPDGTIRVVLIVQDAPTERTAKEEEILDAAIDDLRQARDHIVP